MTGANRYSFITSTILPARRTVSNYVRASLACVRGRELHQVQEWRRYLLDVVLSELRIAYPERFLLIRAPTVKTQNHMGHRG